MKKTLKALSMFLAVLTFLSVFSCSTTVFAENYEKYDNRKAYEKKLLTETVDNTVTSSKISHEVVEKRDEFSKTFMREDGSFTTILSEKPLHKKENGKWKEIDNELNFGSESYRNNSGAFDVEFPKTLSEKNKVSVSNGEETLSFSLKDIESSEAKLPENYNAGKNGVEAAIDKITSKITYENVDDNTDVEYIVSSDSVKENIIVANEKSLKESYSFTIEKGYLTATVDGENNVIFKNKSKKEVFRIPAPVMADAEGNLSYDIDVTLSGENSAEMVLTYTPSKEWLGSAKFPVKIDPVIELPSQQSDFISDTVVTRDLTDPSAQSTNYVNSSSGAICDTVAKESMVLFKINMAAFGFLRSENVKPTSAVFYGDAIFSGNGIIEAKKINAPCDIATVTYADVGSSFLGDTVDYFISEGTPESTGEEEVTTIAHFNIINAFDGWLKGEANNGIALVAGDSSTNATMYLDDETDNTSHFTYITVDYVDASCGSDEYEYTTQEIGRAGTAYINTFTRGLSLKRSDISLPGNRMPADISFHYKGAYNKFIEMFNDIMGIYDDEGVIMPYGNGWLPSYMQYVITIDEKTYLAFTEEGTIVSFTKKTEEKENNTTEITFEPDALGDTGYALQPVDASSTSTDFSNLKLVAPDGSTTFFNEWGFASKVKESEANSDGTYDEINITYDEETGLYVDCVTDGAGRKYQFSYGDNGLLSQVACLDANNNPINAGSTQTPLKVTYSYDGEGNLIGVTYPDGKSISYTYNEDVLTKVQNIDGYNIQYTYDNLKKVTSVKEFAGTTQGNSITLTELSNRQVRVADSYTGTETYQFGTDGKLNYTFDNKENHFKSYNAQSNEKVIKSEDYEVNSVNLLKNGSAELSDNDWADTQTTGATITTTRSISSTVSYMGSKSMCVYTKSVKKGENANSYFRQNLTGLEKNTYYTLSGYIKTDDVQIVTPTTATGAYLHYNEYNETGEEIKHGHTETVTDTTDEDTNRGWQRVSLTFKTDEKCDSVRIYLCLRNATGTAYFDCIQLEKGLGVADYNLMENGSFTDSDESWTDATVVTEDNRKAAKLAGGMPEYDGGDVENHVSSTTQNIAINGKAGDVFSVGGWFKGAFDDNSINPAIVTDTGVSEEQATRSLAQVKVSYTYTNTTTDEDGNETSETLTDNFAVDFAPHNEGWQFAEDSFALKGDATSVDVTVIAQNIPQDTFATDIFFAVDDGAIAFEADEEESEEPVVTESAEGNSADSPNAGVPMEPEEPSCPCDDCEELDCECRCESKEACTCIQCKRRGNIEAVSEDGKTVTQKSYDGTQYMESSVHYSADKNNVLSETDTNGITTSYAYNADGTLANQTDARGKATTYSSNAMGYLAKASVNVTGLSDNKAAMEILYEYEGDLLKEITQGNVLYEYEYDEWGQLKSVSVDNQIIVTYNYDTGINRARLLNVCYGNDPDNYIFKLTYAYNSYGDVESVTKEKDGSSITYNYRFDNLGNLKEISDTALAHIIYYKDDGIKVVDSNTEAVIYESKDNTPEYDEAEENQPVSVTTEAVNGIEYNHSVYESAYNAETGKTTEKEAVASELKALGTQTVSDWFGRNESATVMTKDPTDTSATGFTSISSNYLYKTTGNVTTNLITSINNTISGNKNDTVNYNYSYDPDGRITDISTVSSIANLNGSVKYEFDEVGQIVKETKGDTYFEYSYDSKGNITGRKFYSGENCVTDDSFTYGAETWEDRLTKFNGQDIDYDEIGNPVGYLGATLTWFGRELAGYTKGNKAIAYKYDVDGMRYMKTVSVNGTETARYDYVYSDGTLILLTYTANGVANTARFVYDSFGEPRGFILNDSATYLYLKNGQGDITAIVGEDGEILVRYEYNAWGAVEFVVPFGVDLAVTSTLATVSPFTYRGYCYDYDIGMYYLQSRYYDPGICRFINADSTDYLGATGTVLSYNLFAYCENDGGNNVDPKGTSPVEPLVSQVAQILGFANDVLMAINHYNKNKKYDSSVSKYINGQGLYPYNKIQYGVACLDYNGCEIIAVYNTLRALGKTRKLSKIIYDFELHGATWFNGIFGTKPQAIGSYLRSTGLKTKSFFLTKSMDKYVKSGRVFIICYAHSQGIHTVMAKGLKNGKIKVYNRYSNSSKTYTLDSIGKYVSLDGFKLIIGYYVYK